RGLGLCGDFPVAVEPNEVIQAHRIEAPERAGDTRNKPGEVRLGVLLPAVERVAPALPGLAEIVRWYARHDRAPPFGVEEEERWVRPDVGALIRDEHGQ